MRNFILINILILFCFNVFSEKRITVAIIGASPPRYFNKENPQKIVEHVIKFWEKEIEKVLPYEVDLIVLPEMNDRPKGLSREQQNIYFKAKDNQVFDYFVSVAKKNKCYIVFNTRDYIDSIIYNTSFVINRDGALIGKYNKNYPTIGEFNVGLKPDKTVPVIECDFGRISLAVCFDLNFDELRIKHVEASPDIIIFSSNYHGGFVQNYWAYSVEAFFISACGQDKIPSEVLNPLGEIIAHSTNYFNYTVAEINLDYEIVHLDNNWDKLKKIKEKYKGLVDIHDPGKLGVVMVSSEHKNISSKQMLQEFNVDNAKTYFEKSRTQRNILLEKINEQN